MQTVPAAPQTQSTLAVPLYILVLSKSCADVAVNQAFEFSDSQFRSPSAGLGATMLLVLAIPDTKQKCRWDMNHPHGKWDETYTFLLLINYLTVETDKLEDYALVSFLFAAVALHQLAKYLQSGTAS